MIDTTNWQYFYKITAEGTLWSTNVMYTPLISPDRNTMCMLWDETSEYQNDNSQILTADLINFFFERELNNIRTFQNYSWAPKLIAVEENNRKIFIEWNDNTFNHIFFDPNRNLEHICSDWKEQIFNIVKDIYDAGFYKLALYPHCFYVKNNIIKTFDFYSCVGIKERYIAREKISGVIGIDSCKRFDDSTTSDDMIDFKKFFDLTMNKHLSTYWPDNPFPEFYKKL